MAKSLYTYYKERLIEIGGSNKCLYLKSISKRSAYDVGGLFEGRNDKISELNDFLFSHKSIPLSLINEKEANDILENFNVQERYDKKTKTSCRTTADLLEKEISSIKELAREIDEIERETGRYELYLGYPFVFGTITQGPKKLTVKAPLLLFPVKVSIPDENTVELYRDENQKIQINKAMIFAYAQAKKLNVDDCELEFDDLSELNSVKAVVDYLASNRIRLDMQSGRNVYNYQKFKEPDQKAGLSIRYAAVLGRFSLSNSIYSDYTLLEKKNWTNDAILELLSPKKAKRKSPKKNVNRNTAAYPIRMADYAQSEVVRKAGESGNIVIYGPPGTGKSQTIVNIISDAIVKKKRVLVVSQKKAALDVVYNRLGPLNAKAMYIGDESREKASFYEKCLNAHQKDMVESLADVEGLEKKYAELENRIRAEQRQLDRIYTTLHGKRDFGLSLTEMYESCYPLQKNSWEYSVYQKLLEQPQIMAMPFAELKDALFVIGSDNLDKLYYSFMEDRAHNPIIDHMKSGVDLNTLSEVRERIDEISKAKKGLFNTAKYPYYRQVLAYYYEIRDKKNLEEVVKLTEKVKNPGKLFRGKDRKEVEKEILRTDTAITEFTKEYECLHRVLTPDGYLAVIDNVLRGNTSYVKLVKEALDNYIPLRDVNKLLESLDGSKLLILNFAYTVARNYKHYADILSRLLMIRIYHEITVFEEKCKDDLSVTVDFRNITSRIEELKRREVEVASEICTGKNSREYDLLYASAKNNRDFLYQISKEKNYWPIRKAMDVYSDFILALFPCWLLSPENVSTLLPLKKNMFDLVIFDEASQVFIEATIPTIFRGKNIVVAGDSKQLRPSATFLKRYLGGSGDSADDLSVQAALEVDSLLDLAISRYESANLTYHYRSRSSELIAFSNAAFYSSGLQIAPNTVSNTKPYPIERIKVDGRFIDRKNLAEAEKVAETVRSILKNRKHGESIGIITFNSDQQTAIADALDALAAKHADFRAALSKEQHRYENGEDISLFIKNLENVQGDERDVIIFSIGYAPGESGKIYLNFGSLSTEGGENRLNVAITRAKTKIIVVTSIEPEELKVDVSKNQGPKLLREYLKYVRAVSSGDSEAAEAVLRGLSPAEESVKSVTGLSSVEEQMKERLEKLGYSVSLALGNRKNRISLAVRDKGSQKFLVGVILDRDACLSSDAILERDVYQPMFLTSRGWHVIRIFSRDYWISPAKVIKSITTLAEKVKNGEADSSAAQ